MAPGMTEVQFDDNRNSIGRVRESINENSGKEVVEVQA